MSGSMKEFLTARWQNLGDLFLADLGNFGGHGRGFDPRLVEKALGTHEVPRKVNWFLAGFVNCVVGNRFGGITKLDQCLIDVGRLLCLVRFEDNDFLSFDNFFCSFGIQSEPLVDFASRSPVGREIDDHRPAFGKMLSNRCVTVGLVLQFVPGKQCQKGNCCSHGD